MISIKDSKKKHTENIKRALEVKIYFRFLRKIRLLIWLGL